MSTQINLVSSYSATDNIVLFTKDKSKINASFFNAEEIAFIKKELSAEKKNVVINQYNRYVFVQFVDKKDESNKMKEAMRKAADSWIALFNKMKIASVVLVDDKMNSELLAFAEGLALGNYQFLNYKTDKEKVANTFKEINIRCTNIKQTKVDHLNIVIDATLRARDLVNEPNSYLTATKLAEKFEQLGKEAGFKVEVFNKQKIESMKMGGLLAVNLGSPEPPTFTIMEYKPREPKYKKPFVLVGKGVVYDTGGLSLKPTLNSMDYMKCDMGGAAAVGCAMYAIAKAKLPIHVIALVPATDNRPGGNAYVPGDVITMMSGLTVEVLNTDAEGRMILADALHFAKQYEPKLVMEFSTLTGAASAAIGHFGLVCMGTAEEKVKNRLKESGEDVHERLAEFPFWEEYDELIKSDVAEIKNVGGPVGGAITAGKFLARFTDYPYIHFDIAGPAFTSSRDSYRGKGGTGVGVRLLFDYFRGL